MYNNNNNRSGVPNPEYQLKQDIEKAFLAKINETGTRYVKIIPRTISLRDGKRIWISNARLGRHYGSPNDTVFIQNNPVKFYNLAELSQICEAFGVSLNS